MIYEMDVENQTMHLLNSFNVLCIAWPFLFNHERTNLFGEIYLGKLYEFLVSCIRLEGKLSRHFTNQSNSDSVYRKK